jgi:miniconductance mechanosensitive channel
MMIEQLKNIINDNKFFNNELKYIAIIGLAFLAYLLFRSILIPLLKKVAKNTATAFDDILFQRKVLHRFSLIAPIIVLKSFTYLLPSVKPLLDTLFAILLSLVITFTIGAIFSTISEYLQQLEKFKERPIKAYIQIIIIIVYSVGFVYTIGLAIGSSPMQIITGLGVFTAVIALLFKDPILSFVASIQITSYDLIKVGDWIEVPKYNADGDVIDVSLSVVKIQNFDKTITSIPTYKLIEDSFKNWRGMKIAGARRIKRSVFIDQATIKFCDDEMLNKFEKIKLISDYVKNKRIELAEYNKNLGQKEELIINQRRLTNVGTFRAYLQEYLKQRKDLRKDLTFIVRQLEPGPEGLPIELYIFVDTTEWTLYENIQSDIFDHILAVISQFELGIYQRPSGKDFSSILMKEKK